MTQEHIDALKEELAQIDAKLAEVKTLEARRRQLLGGWNDKGEIVRARRELRDSKFPVLQAGGFRKTRIIEVNDKWIVTREDGADNNEVVRYRVSDGCRERSRNGSFGIDAKAALSIWEAHKCDVA